MAKYNREYLEKEYKRVSNELENSGIIKRFQNHCYLRMANDAATANKWTNVVDKPFLKNATDKQLQKSVETLWQMQEDHESIDILNMYSLHKRNKLSKPKSNQTQIFSINKSNKYKD